MTSKIPPGPDVDLLIIGKTGHGKSSTGNSILGQNKFFASADGESVTSECGVGWRLIDDRTIKVVDTPGVCDTRPGQSSIDVAIRAISEAIAQCPNGFHSLLLVIRFGQRMTTEEQKAIGMLKCILGPNIIKEHCVCIITYGDNFRQEIKNKKTFEEWCKDQKGFLSEIFIECDYRCVLFDNKNEDDLFQKQQLIDLIRKVDSLQSHGTRYTNSLFELAQNEKKMIIEEENSPELNENVARDIELVIDHLDKMVENPDETNTFGAEFENLRKTVDKLKNEVSEMKGKEVEKLVNTVFLLAEAVHAKKDEVDKKAVLLAEQEKLIKNNSENPHVADFPSSPENSSPNSFQKNLEPLREELKDTKNTMDPKKKSINEKVTDKVEEEVKQGGSCFPGDSLVIMTDGSTRPMQHLNIGDEVLVKNRHGKMVFEKVYMFGHLDPIAVSDFIVFDSQSQCDISVTGDHFVYCLRDGDKFCLPAREIKLGDNLMIFNGASLIPQCVLSITVKKKTGLFAPFTKSGCIIVDCALMSCYVDVVSAAWAHILLSPIRTLNELSPSTLEFINGSKRGQKIPTWAKFILKMRKRHAPIIVNSKKSICHM